MKCLIDKSEIKPFHTFEKRTLLNKPIEKNEPKATAKMDLGFNSKTLHISSELESAMNHDELINEIYTELYKSFSHVGLSKNQERYTNFVGKWLSNISPNNDKVLEIGCHDGYLLNMLSKSGRKCVGVEPSPFAEYAKQTYGLDVKNDFFKPAMFDKNEFDLVIARHVLEHVPDPREFLDSILEVLKPGGIAYIEVPNSFWSLENCYYPEFHVDHISYFTMGSLSKLINNTNICEILHTEVFGGYIKFPFLMSLLKKDLKGKATLTDNWFIDYKIDEHINNFTSKYETYIKSINSLSSKSMVVWGCGSIGSQYAVDGDWNKDNITFVDPNNAAQGKVLSVTGHHVYSPEIINDIKPEILLIASAWEDDVREQAKEFIDSKTKVLCYDDLIGGNLV